MTARENACDRRVFAKRCLQLRIINDAVITGHHACAFVRNQLISAHGGTQHEKRKKKKRERKRGTAIIAPVGCTRCLPYELCIAAGLSAGTMLIFERRTLLDGSV